MHRTSKATRKPEYVSKFGILLQRKSSTAPKTAKISAQDTINVGHLHVILNGRKN